MEGRAEEGILMTMQALVSRAEERRELSKHPKMARRGGVQGRSCCLVFEGGVSKKQK